MNENLFDYDSDYKTAEETISLDEEDNEIENFSNNQNSGKSIQFGNIFYARWSNWKDCLQ